jgi:hypothetical protein
VTTGRSAWLLARAAPTGHSTKIGRYPVDAERYRPLAELVQEGLSVQGQLNISGGHGTLTLPDVETAKRRWHDAVTMQATLSGQSEADADRAVTSMVNELLRLARLAPWWESHAAEAITETVEHASGNLAVDSAPAQRAWGTYWSLRSLLSQLASPDPGELADEELQALPDRLAEAEAEWRAAWELWHAERCPDQ